jgi:hypothetical protein
MITTIDLIIILITPIILIGFVPSLKELPTKKQRNRIQDGPLPLTPIYIIAAVMRGPLAWPYRIARKLAAPEKDQVITAQTDLDGEEQIVPSSNLRRDVKKVI